MLSNPAVRKNTVTINGDMDALTVRSLRTRFEQLVETDRGSVVINMQRVQFIDSSGIGALVFLYKRLLAQGRDFSVIGLHGQPLSLFQQLRIDRTITIEKRTGSPSVGSDASSSKASIDGRGK